MSSVTCVLNRRFSGDAKGENGWAIKNTLLVTVEWDIRKQTKGGDEDERERQGGMRGGDEDAQIGVKEGQKK